MKLGLNETEDDKKSNETYDNNDYRDMRVADDDYFGSDLFRVKLSSKVTCDRQRHLLLETKSQDNCDVIDTDLVNHELSQTRRQSYMNIEHSNLSILPSSAEATASNLDQELNLPSLEQAETMKTSSESHIEKKYLEKNYDYKEE